VACPGGGAICHRRPYATVRRTIEASPQRSPLAVPLQGAITALQNIPVISWLCSAAAARAAKPRSRPATLCGASRPACCRMGAWHLVLAYPRRADRGQWALIALTGRHRPQLLRMHHVAAHVGCLVAAVCSARGRRRAYSISPLHCAGLLRPARAPLLLPPLAPVSPRDAIIGRRRDT